MLFLSFLLFLFRYSQALPTVYGDDRDFSNYTSPSDAMTPSGKRTLFGIVWSCVLTVMICAWTSVHPNIPPTTRGIAFWKRIGMMFWALIAPELILAWAVRQWYAAYHIKDQYNLKLRHSATKWKTVHGYFLEMGGFLLVNEDPATGLCTTRVLTIDLLEKLFDDVNFTFPDITAAEIKDKSKGDALSKFIAILQTTWFIVHCLVRLEQGLAVTSLELITLTLASQNAITYMFWWHKPLGVHEPLKIRSRVNLQNWGLAEKDSSHCEHGCFTSTLAEVISKTSKFVEPGLQHIFNFARNPSQMGFRNAVYLPFIAFFAFTIPLFVPFPLAIILLLEVIKTRPIAQDDRMCRGQGFVANQIIVVLHKFRYKVTSSIETFFGIWLGRVFDDTSLYDLFVGWYILLPALFFLLLTFVVLLIPFFAFFFLFTFIFESAFSVTSTSAVRPGATHVPSFYAPPTENGRYSRMVVFALFGVIFGGLHCIGWCFFYPTSFEQTLWQVTSIVITIIPLIVAPIDFILERHHEKLGTLPMRVMDLTMTVLLVIYVPARLSLIAQALALLRSQPQSVLIAVNWTIFIPHLSW